MGGVLVLVLVLGLAAPGSWLRATLVPSANAAPTPLMVLTPIWFAVTAAPPAAPP